MSALLSLVKTQPDLNEKNSELRAALEALRIETDKQAGGRLKLAGEIRKDVEVRL